MAMIWITHDLGVVAGLAERVIVMYSGFIVEEAIVDEIYENPRHPYTHALLGALPRIDRRRRPAPEVDPRRAAQLAGRSAWLPIRAPLRLCHRSLPARKPSP